MALPRSSLVKKLAADGEAKPQATLLPPRPAGLANAVTVPRPLPNAISRNAVAQTVPREPPSSPASHAPASLIPKAAATPRPITARPQGLTLTPVSTRPPVTLASPVAAKMPTPVATPAPISIRPSNGPMSPVEKARVETLITQVDASDTSPQTIPETMAAAVVPAPESSVSVKGRSALSPRAPGEAVLPSAAPSSARVVAFRSAPAHTIPDADPSVPLVSPEPPHTATARIQNKLTPSPFPVHAPVPVSRTAPIAAPAPSPWRVVTPVHQPATHALPWAPATPIPSPIITPAASSAPSLASCDIQLDDAARQNSLLSFSDLAGMARDPMRSGASSSGSIVLGDPVIRQKMMSIVAARRRRFTGVVFSAVAVCACVCAAAIVGSVASSGEPEAAADNSLRGLRVAKEELLVPTHKHASNRARRW